MAVTLDSLELDIQSDAKGASSAIHDLIGSLKSLIGPVSNAMGPLKSLNAELKALKANSSGLNVGKILDIGNSAKKAKQMSDSVSDTLKSTIAIEKSKVRVRTIQRNGYNFGVSPMDPAFVSAVEANRARRNALRESVGGSGISPSDVKVRTIVRRPEGDYRYGVSPMDPEFLEAVRKNQEKKREWNKSILNSRVNPDSQDIQRRLSELDPERSMRNLGQDTKKTADAFTSLKEKIQGIFKGGLLQQFGRVAKMRAIRAVIMGLVNGLKEGLGNLKSWSDGVNGHFSQAMNAAQDNLTLMKNSVATALAPAIEAAIPLFITLTSVINAASNALAQFFALLTGQSTWTKATLAAGEYTKAAKGAGGASKDLLADWDELNIIQSSGGGGGGSGSGGFAGMFEEMPLPTWMTQWKPLIDAVLAGTLGGIILPKIFDVVKKIMGLFGGSGAANALDIFKRMNKLPDTDLTDVTKDIKDLVDTVNKPLANNGLNDLLNGLGDDSLNDILKKLSPLTDLFKDTNFVDTINGLLGLAKDIGDKFDWKTLLPSTIDAITKLFDGEDKIVKVEVDDSEYNRFKEAFLKDRFEKTIEIKLGNGFSDFEKKNNAIHEWAANDAVKNVSVNVNSIEFYRVSKDVLNFCSNDSKKNVFVSMDDGNAIDTLKSIDSLCGIKSKKNVVVSIDDGNANDVLKSIDNLCGIKSRKNVVVSVYDSNVFGVLERIDQLCMKESTKNVVVNVNDNGLLDTLGLVDILCEQETIKNVLINVNDNGLLDTLGLVDRLCAQESVKDVIVSVDSSAFDDFKESLDAWCSEPIKKTIQLDTIYASPFESTGSSSANPRYVYDSASDPFEYTEAEKKPFFQKVTDGASNLWTSMFGSGDGVNGQYAEPIYKTMDESSAALAGCEDTVNLLLPQILSAVQQVAVNVMTVNTTVENKDTKPVVNVTIPGGSPMSRFMGLSGVAFDRVTGDN